MDIVLFLDLMKECVVDSLRDNFEMVDIPGENTVVISDDARAGEKWADFAVIGVEHSEQISGVSYVTDSVENIDKDFVKEVFCRKWGLSLVIKETGRLIIREITVADVENICRLYADVENVRYLPAVASYEEECERCKEYIKNMYGMYGYGLWGVFLKENDSFIGRVGLEHRRLGDEVYVELGYLIDRDYQGQGYAYEAACAVIEFAREYGIEDLVAYIDEKNTPSIKLAQKLGFTRQCLLKDGENEYVLFRL